ncbi:MAG: hypothetical protein QM770_09235 [Tepidisphaeraceae bacterium]
MKPSTSTLSAIWTQYRKTFVYVQAMTALVVLAMFFAGHVRPAQCIVTALVMELCGLTGAAWSLRIKRRLESNATTLLMPRRR